MRSFMSRPWRQLCRDGHRGPPWRVSPWRGTTTSPSRRQEHRRDRGRGRQLQDPGSLVGQAGLAETLATGGTFTVFAPTDAAFAKVPKKTLATLAANPEQLKAVLLYHVAKGELRAKKVVKRSSIKTLNGARVKVKVRRGSVKVNNARILKTNVDASNGVIHVINRVLIPPTGDDD